MTETKHSANLKIDEAKVLAVREYAIKQIQATLIFITAHAKFFEIKPTDEEADFIKYFEDSDNWDIQTAVEALQECQEIYRKFESRCHDASKIFN